MVRGPHIDTLAFWSPLEASLGEEGRKSQPMFGNVLPGAAALSHSGSAPPPRGRVSPARADRKSPPGDPTVTARHGSGQNTSPNDGGDHRQVQQEPVHGGPLRTTPGEFGSAGSEVRCLGAGRGACTCCAACSRFIFLHNGAA